MLYEEENPNSGKKTRLPLLLWCSSRVVVSRNAWCTCIPSSIVARFVCVYPPRCCSMVCSKLCATLLGCEWWILIGGLKMLAASIEGFLVFGVLCYVCTASLATVPLSELKGSRSHSAVLCRKCDRFCVNNVHID